MKTESVFENHLRVYLRLYFSFLGEFIDRILFFLFCVLSPFFLSVFLFIFSWFCFFISWIWKRISPYIFVILSKFINYFPIFQPTIDFSSVSSSRLPKKPYKHDLLVISSSTNENIQRGRVPHTFTKIVYELSDTMGFSGNFFFLFSENI